MITREPIYAALFAKINALVGSPVSSNQPFVSASRRLQSVTKVQPERQPAIFQVQSRETPTQIKKGFPTRWNLKPELWVFIWQPDATSAVSPIINPIIDAIEKAFSPDNQMQQDCTLGGLVSHCRIEGRDIEIYEGVTTGSTGYQSVVIIPIDIMTA